MYNIVEKKGYDGTYFEKRSVTSNYTDIIHIKIATVKIEGTTYSYLYNSRLEPIIEVFRYINFELDGSSPNHVSVVLHALKLLYTFLEIFGLKIEMLTNADAKNFISFLKGIPRQGTLYSFEFSTHRSNSSINNYLAVYRQYLIYLGIIDSVLLRKQNKSHTIQIPESDLEIKVSNYQIQAKAYTNTISAPKYISIADFAKLIAIIRRDYTSREECIVRLMYESGLRIGEVLGLTGDDIEVVETPQGQLGYLYLRNRCSDTPDSRAKTCLQVSHSKQYASKEYNTKDVGFQVAIANINLVNRINDYVNEFHTITSGQFQLNYLKYNIADRIRKDQPGELRNYYIFINSIGKPLSANLWNKTLRNIFHKAGLHVDVGVKETNLNHRFRHGFAMFMVKYRHISTFDLKLLMRHRSIQSTSAYYRPTDEDIASLKSDFVSSIYDLIPELSI